MLLESWEKVARRWASWGDAMVRQDGEHNPVEVFGKELAYQLNGAEGGRRTSFVGRSSETCSSDSLL